MENTKTLKTLVQSMVNEAIKQRFGIKKPFIYKTEIEYWVEDIDGEIIPEKYNEVLIEVLYRISGKYMPATWEEPADYPEVDIEAVLWTNPETGIKEPIDEDKIFFSRRGDLPELKIPKENGQTEVFNRIYLPDWEEEMLDRMAEDAEAAREDALERKAERMREKDY